MADNYLWHTISTIRGLLNKFLSNLPPMANPTILRSFVRIHSQPGPRVSAVPSPSPRHQALPADYVFQDFQLGLLTSSPTKIPISLSCNYIVSKLTS